MITDQQMELKQTQLEAYIRSEFNTMVNEELFAYHTENTTYEFVAGNRFNVFTAVPAIYSNLGYFLRVQDEEIVKITVFGIMLINGIELGKQFEINYTNEKGFNPTMMKIVKEANDLYELMSTTERKMKEDSFLSVDRIVNTQYDVDGMKTPIVDNRVKEIIINLTAMNYNKFNAERVAKLIVYNHPEEQDIDTLTHAALSLPLD